MKKTVIAGATGMIGRLVLKNCLASDEINRVNVLVRKKINNNDKKLKQIVVSDFCNYDKQAEFFKKIDIAFFCLGAYTGNVSKDDFYKITVDYAVAFAKQLYENSPKATLCLLSGSGADRKEKSKIAFARYKGIAENRISKMGFKNFYCFRPAYIYPVSPRKEPNFVYKLSRFLYPVFKLLGKDFTITSTQLADAMFRVGINGGKKEILSNRQTINILKNCLKDSKKI